MGFLRAEARANAGRPKKLEQERPGQLLPGIPRASVRKRKKLEQERVGQLLPGIPNEVSVDEVAAKFLTWKDLCVLSCVSHGWCEAVRSREVYRARFHSHSTETLSLVCHCPFSSKPVSLQSTTNNYCYRLPLIPGFSQMPFSECQLVALGGRIFVLGGQKMCTVWEDRLGFLYSNEVYSLDLAGQKQWKRCASMKQGRGSFGGAVLNGKIYVFGGCQLTYTKNEARSQEPVCGSEVYDPQRDTWTGINAMPSWCFCHDVIQVGPMLVMHGGFIFGPRQLGRFGNYEITRAFSVEIYHPDNDVWKVVSPDEVFPQARIAPIRQPSMLGGPSSFTDSLGCLSL